MKRGEIEKGNEERKKPKKAATEGGRKEDNEIVGERKWVRGEPDCVLYVLTVAATDMYYLAHSLPLTDKPYRLAL
jgi:hypothetical protein